jgi:plastocyanin
VWAAVGLAAVLAVGGCGSSGSGNDNGSSSGPADVTVKAEDSLKFDSSSYTASSGEVAIRYENGGSLTHTLLIQDKKGFKLKVTSKGDTDQGSIDLEPGTYTIYCDIPGHRSAGMHATLTVS